LKQAGEFSGRKCNTSLLLFTDGEPNINPPMGIIPSLTEALSETKFDFSISTFGFGYHIDSKLMEGTARQGHGIYGYCPDCTLVGTIFINYLAASLTTIAQSAIVEIRNPKYQAKYNLTLFNGASRNILVELNDANVTETQIILTIPAFGDRIVIDQVSEAQDDNLIILQDQIYRYKFMKVISNNLFDITNGLQETKLLFNEINQLQNPSEYEKSLAIDLVDPHPNHGQVEKAFSNDFFLKWGNDYLRSLLLFHEAEQCGNFKDQSLQNYGGPVFAEYREFANKIFINLPAPVLQSVQSDEINKSGNQNTSSSQVMQMSRFYDSRAACFDENAFVKLCKGEKRVKDFMKGDVLADGGIVECVMEIVESHSHHIIRS
jgi:hypothetical protein